MKKLPNDKTAASAASMNPDNENQSSEECWDLGEPKNLSNEDLLSTLRLIFG
ncbi:MAG: hypothetical protein H7249_08820, partial [Chitinophagaceae bacterium]|nr:hypothetical protein [Oligoflexus sp.]